MPVYRYHCTHCNLKFELKQGFNDKSIVACPKCKNESQRLFSPVPVIFKGSGFYVTDNRKNAGEDTGDVKLPKTKEVDKGTVDKTK